MVARVWSPLLQAHADVGHEHVGPAKGVPRRRDRPVAAGRALERDVPVRLRGEVDAPVTVRVAVRFVRRAVERADDQADPGDALTRGGVDDAPVEANVAGRRRWRRRRRGGRLRGRHDAAAHAWAAAGATAGAASAAGAAALAGAPTATTAATAATTVPALLAGL